MRHQIIAQDWHPQPTLRLAGSGRFSRVAPDILDSVQVLHFGPDKGRRGVQGASGYASAACGNQIGPTCSFNGWRQFGSRIGRVQHPPLQASDLV